MKKEAVDVSILGSGDMAKGIGTRLTAGGNDITLYDRNPEKAQTLANQLQELVGNKAHIEAKPLGSPFKGDIVILAVPYSAIPEIIKRYGDQLAKKIIVDITNPIDWQTFKLVTPAGSSAAEEIARIAPEGTKVVKAFNTTFARTLAEGGVDGKQIDVFVAGDDDKAKRIISNLINDSGLRALNAGPLQSARALEGIQLIHITLQKQLGSNFLSSIKILP